MKKYEVLSPACFSRFTCKGGDCRLTCCGEWSITLTKDEYRETRKKKPEARDLIQKKTMPDGSDRVTYEIILDEKKQCPFLSDERLCSLQMEFGFPILSHTCKVYPRVYYKYMNKLEAGMSLGCEGVLELLLEEKGHLEFTNYSKSFPDSYGFTGGVDARKRMKYPALPYFYDIQSLCISMLQAEDATLEDRMILLGMALFQVDRLAAEGRASEIPGYIHRFEQGMEEIDAAAQIGKVKGASIGVLYNNLLIAKKYSSTENHHYTALVRKIEERLGLKFTVTASEEEGKMEGSMEISEETYHSCQENYARFMEGKEYFLENFMVAWMFQRNAPFFCPENGVWKDYTFLVWGYSMIKFALTMALDENSTDEDMISCCVTMFRKIGHIKPLYDSVVNTLEENQNNTVAHMAVFLKS